MCETVNRFCTFGRTVDEKIGPFKDLYAINFNAEGGKDAGTLLRSYVASGIRNHDPNVRAVGDGTVLKATTLVLYIYI